MNAYKKKTTIKPAATPAAGTTAQPAAGISAEQHIINAIASKAGPVGSAQRAASFLAVEQARRLQKAREQQKQKTKTATPQRKQTQQPQQPQARNTTLRGTANAVPPAVDINWPRGGGDKQPNASPLGYLAASNLPQPTDKAEPIVQNNQNDFGFAQQLADERRQADAENAYWKQQSAQFQKHPWMGFGLHQPRR